MVTARDHKKRLLQEVEQLSPERVRSLADFAAYLREREDWEETNQILGDADLMRQITKSRQAWSKGRKKEFVSLDDLKAELGV